MSSQVSSKIHLEILEHEKLVSPMLYGREVIHHLVSNLLTARTKGPHIGREYQL